MEEVLELVEVFTERYGSMAAQAAREFEVTRDPKTGEFRMKK